MELRWTSFLRRKNITKYLYKNKKKIKKNSLIYVIVERRCDCWRSEKNVHA